VSDREVRVCKHARDDGSRKRRKVGSSSKTARSDVKETRERVKGLVLSKVLFSKVKKKKTNNRAYE